MVYLVQIVYTNVFQHCLSTGMQNDDEASPNIISAGRAFLVTMFITFELHGIFGSNFVYLCILILSSHWYEKCEEAAPSIISADLALLVKMFITLEPPYAFV